MRALVTGGSGFIGSHVVNKLIERDIKVRIFDLLYPEYHEIDGDWIQFFHGSLLDSDALRVALHKTDFVIHLAAIADVYDVVKEPSRAENINVRGTANVLEAVRLSGIERIIYISTIWVYSDVGQEYVSEVTSIVSPSHFYTVTKYVGELYCNAYAKMYGLKPTILRYGIPYGPGARGTAVIPQFVKKAFSKEKIIVAGDGSQYRKFVYVEDLAEGTVLALKDEAIGQTYNLDGEERVTIKNIVDKVEEIIGRDVFYTFGPLRGTDFSGKEVSTEKAKKELGWEPKVDFDTGLRRYIEWWKNEESIGSGSSS